MKDYKEKYEMALETVQEILDSGADSIKMSRLKLRLRSVFSELKESDEEIKEALIELVKCNERNGYTLLNNVSTSSMINWLEKQGQEIIPQPKNSNSLSTENDNLKNAIIKFFEDRYPKAMEIYDDDFTTTVGQILAWLEKQGEQIDIANKEYWRGYREGKKEILDKYAELEQQIVQNINIPWHDVSEEPEEQREIFCKWKIWHDVVFYHADTKTFWNGEYQIEDVIKWAYIDDILKEQPQSYLVPKSASQAIQEEKIDNANKVESKFKVGDWVVNKLGDVWHIDSFDKKNYQVSDGKGNYNYFPISKQDEMHLWTIQDAKDGDILACKNGWACIFKRLNDNIFSSHCFMDSEGWFCENGGQAYVLDNSINCHPATKEQRELLFTKLKESGHEWDADKKEIINTL